MKKWCKSETPHSKLWGIPKNKLFLVILIFILLINASFISAQKYELKVTEEHPFFVDNEWIPAKELKVGDYLITNDGKKAKITSIKEVIPDKPIEVYNLEALPFNDFIVDGNVVVHNSNQFKNPLELITELQNLGNYPNRVRRFNEIYRQRHGRDLSPEQLALIEEVHNMPYDPNLPYWDRVKQMAAKLKRLVDSGLFDKKDADLLLRGRVCGPEPNDPDIIRIDAFFESLGSDAGNAAWNIQDYMRRFQAYNSKAERLKPLKGQYTRVMELPESCPEAEARAILSGVTTPETRPWSLDAFVEYRNNQPVLLDPRTRQPLSGGFYILILRDGTAFIHPDLNTLLRLYPRKIVYLITVDPSTGKTIRTAVLEPDYVHSLVHVTMLNGAPYRNPETGLIYPELAIPGTCFDWFRFNFRLRWDSLSRPQPQQ